MDAPITFPMRTRTTTNTSGVDRGSLIAWLGAFAETVRTIDYEGAEPTFDRDAIAFGTVGRMMIGRDVLVESQWKRVWGVTEGFAFDLDAARCGSDGNLGWVVATWSSTGRRARDGAHFERHGRATFILQHRDDRWVALHSHFSLNPRGVGPDET